jgi:hypothetical protein
MWKQINIDIASGACVHDWQHYSHVRIFDTVVSTYPYETRKDSVVEHFRACRKCGIIEQSF